ncbi:ParB N-terminal domain-containing protein [Rhodococcus sp. ARC_M6]|uniref:ParB N-terminal domain-containing protein n=1 Tax=Rhodococcus sp. ARC_M6 TaxID=2928852 RepID=UPI001FB1C2E5|nr:ParB N-terminal domain-containing protein [Rhodococcus sp. ARC_M6]MCJ0906243.1 ParB N-terminal domain-containing protein [Rhodococcus sp. ARC_M6]
MNEINEIIVGIHPYAEKFPMLQEVELSELADSIRANGLRNPIVVTLDGLLLDGRNRREACARAGVTPTVVVYEGDDFAEYVIDCNSARRNLTSGQRAMCDALVYLEDGRRGDGRWRRGAIDIGTGSDSEGPRKLLSWAGIILDYKPDLAIRVTSGELSIKEAFTLADAIRTSAERDKIMAREKVRREKDEAAAEAEANAKIVADLTIAGETKFLDLVNDGVMTPRVAWAAYREETRKQREAEQAERDAQASYFNGISRAIRVAASSAGHMHERMQPYDPADLDERHNSAFTEEKIDALLQFAHEMKAWVTSK